MHSNWQNLEYMTLQSLLQKYILRKQCHARQDNRSYWGLFGHNRRLLSFAISVLSTVYIVYICNLFFCFILVALVALKS